MGGDRWRKPTYRRQVKFVLVIAAVAASVVLGAGATIALAAPQRACVVPRLYALSPAAAKTRLAAAGCSFGRMAFERPHADHPRVTDQVPAPGAVLPRHTRVSLLVS
jgi:beta-lactam-binding protein with PASTA domain